MYQLNLNSNQAKVVIAGLDVLSRIGMGQLEAVAEHVPEPRQDFTGQSLQLMREELNKAKAWLGQPPGGSYGIGHEKTTNEAKVAWDIQCVLRKVVATEEKHGLHSVWHYDPLHYGSEPLATAAVVRPFTEQPFSGDFVGTGGEM